MEFVVLHLEWVLRYVLILYFFFIVSLLSDDPRQQVYQFEGHRFSYSKEKNNSRNDDQLGIDLDLDIFEDTNDIESDDFYGTTREIIIFAEKG